MMSSERYLTELSGYLNPLSKEEKKNAMEYYREYVADLEANGENIEEKLGSPRDLANSVLSDAALKSINDPDAKVHKKMHGCLIAILVVLALPIGVPLAIAALAVVFSIFIAALAIVFAFVVCALAFVGVGVVTIITGTGFLFSVPMTGITLIGISFGMVGLSILAILIVIKLCQFTFWLIGKIFNSTIGKKKDKEVQ